MFGKKPDVNPLELRKRLLVVESNLNRGQMLEEWQVMAHEMQGLTYQVKTVGALATAAATLVAGVSAFRRGNAESTGVKSSWIQSVLKGAQMICSIGSAFGRGHGGENN
ncbi:MAG: hypothetical protein JWR19_188 [Pedosphaera sp.]|nr:hypothetical protein [Pedosphaera sp.]